MPIRMGPIAFNSGVAVLQNSRVDFIIGMDVLNMFESEINIKERWMKLRAEDKAYKIPFTSHSLNKAISTDESNRNHWTLDRPSSAMSWIPSLSGGARANGSPAVSDDAPDAAASISLEGV